MFYFDCFPSTITLGYVDGWTTLERPILDPRYPWSRPVTSDLISPGLLLTCKQLRGECLRHIFTTTTFSFGGEDNFFYMLELSKPPSYIRDPSMSFGQHITRIELTIENAHDYRHVFGQIYQNHCDFAAAFPMVRRIALTLLFDHHPVTLSHFRCILRKLLVQSKKDHGSCLSALDILDLAIPFLKGKDVVVRSDFISEEDKTHLEGAVPGIKFVPL